MDIEGKSYNWLKQFLFDRTFAAQVGSCQSSFLMQQIAFLKEVLLVQYFLMLW